MSARRTPQPSPEGDCPPTPPRDRVRALLFAPLPELNPPGFSSEQLAGLRELPSFCEHLKLIFGLRALEPLAEGPPTATVATLTLAADLLSAVGSFAARNPNVTLGCFRDAATLTLIHLCPRKEEPPGEEAQLLPAPETLLLEAAELALLRRARSAGTSEESLGCAAGMLVALWELADHLRQSPGASPGELIRANGWKSPSSEKILVKLVLGCAVGELASDGRGLGLLRAFRSPAARRGRRRSGRRSAKGGRGA